MMGSEAIEAPKPKRVTGSRFCMIEAPDELYTLNWFRSLEMPVREIEVGEAIVLHFSTLGELARFSDGSFDHESSPVVWLHIPQVRRGALWTVGEAYFTPRDLRQAFPPLFSIKSKFQKWLNSQDVAWHYQRNPPEGDGYYLEGSIRNFAQRIYASPNGMDAHEAGQYFVHHSDNEAVLDEICRKLMLRGVGFERSGPSQP